MLWATRSLRIALRQTLNSSRIMSSDTMGTPGPVESTIRDKVRQVDPAPEQSLNYVTAHVLASTV